MIVLIVVIVIVVLLGLGLWAAFNGLVKKRNRTQEAWSEIDVELKRRHDLIPNLVSTVQGYAAHEQGTFEAVTQARANAVTAGATGDPADRPGRERPVRRAALAVRGGRELPAAAGGRELPAAAGDADRHRGQDRVRPPLLQHQRPGLQHRAADLPAQPDRRAVRLQGGGLLRRRRGGPRRAPGQLPRLGQAAAGRPPARAARRPPAPRASRRPPAAPRARRRPAEPAPPPADRRCRRRAQTDWPEAIFSRAAIRSSIGGWVS